MERPTEKQQAENCKKDAEAAKTAREQDRRARAARCGILNRKNDLSLERIRRAKAACNCGALVNGTVHKGDCPAVLESRGNRR